MKRLLIIPFLLNAGILNEYKQKELNLDKKISIIEAEKTKKSWINPIIIQYQYSGNSANKDNFSHQQIFSISLNQPIFKSGAIYYSIKYAKDLKNLNLTNLKLQKNALIKQALDLAYDYKVTSLNKKILYLNIKNAKIDVKRKKEDYQKGTLDLTFLNNAILNLNNLKISLQDLNYNLEEIKSSFKNISSADIDKLNLNIFKIISQKEYLNKNLELKIAKKQIKINKDLHKMQIGDTLFSVFVNASWNYQKNDYPAKKENNYYSAGIGISFPIDFTAKEKIEKTKLNFLKSNIVYLDKKNQLKNEYIKIIKQINFLKKKIKIYEDNIKIYNELIKSTKDSIKAGNATLDDLKILQNSQKINFLNIKIIKLQIQKLLLNLYYKTIIFYLK